MRMSSLHFLFVPALLAISFLSAAQYTEVINSNRPSQTMGAFSVGKQVYQLEQGISFRSGKFDRFYNASYSGLGSYTQLRVGLFKEQLELVGTLDYQMDELSYQNAVGTYNIDRSGIRDLGAGFKYLVYDPFRNTEKYKVNFYSWHANNRIRWRDLIPAVSVYAGAQFSIDTIYPYQENFSPLFRFNYRPIEAPFVSGTALLIMQQHLRPGLVVVHNVGMRYILADVQQKKIMSTVTYSTKSKWSFYGEYIIDDSSLYSDVTLGGGVAYLFNNNIQLDVAVQQSLKTTPSLLNAGLGLSYRLDRHNIWQEQPQSLTETKLNKEARKNNKREEKDLKNSERRTTKGLRKLDKKQKRIERKLKRVK